MTKALWLRIAAAHGSTHGTGGEPCGSSAPCCHCGVLVRTTLGALALGVALLSACGPGTTSTVRGTVTIDGVPVPGGRIVFRNETTTLDGPVDAEGRYSLSWRGRPEVPIGDYGVFLLPPPAPIEVDRTTGEVRARAPADDATHPLHLRTVEGSGVTRRIEPGEMTITVDFRGRPRP